MLIKLECKYINNILAEIKLIEIRNDKTCDLNQLYLQLDNFNKYGMTLKRANKELKKFLLINKGARLIYDNFDLKQMNQNFTNKLQDYFIVD